jgi:hypothetical protein
VLSNDVPVSGPDPDKSDRVPNPPRASQGVLANLPRTRPQRSSPRRAAAREAQTAAPKRRAAGTPKPAIHSQPVQEPVPSQGFESPGEGTSGSVQPPGGAELVASSAELIGELAKASVSRGERLLKDALSRLPLP